MHVAWLLARQVFINDASDFFICCVLAVITLVATSLVTQAHVSLGDRLSDLLFNRLSDPALNDEPPLNPKRLVRILLYLRSSQSSFRLAGMPIDFALLVRAIYGIGTLCGVLALRKFSD